MNMEFELHMGGMPGKFRLIEGMNLQTITELIKAAGSLAAFVTGLMAYLSSRAVKQKVEKVAILTDQTAAQTNSMMEKTVEIHTATNGHLAALRDEVSTANEKIAGLKALIANMSEARSDAKLAEVKAEIERKQ
jgi:hypothetical protein